MSLINRNTRNPYGPIFEPAYEEWLDSVSSLEELDGCGPLVAPIFCDLARSRVQFPVKTIYEWCCGPAWIGFRMLDVGMCSELVLSDINPLAVECAKMTAKSRGYEDSVHAYVSDNLEDVPKKHRFDFVVGNPPSYCNINRDHMAGSKRDDIRGSDVDWNVHRGFYKEIANRMAPDAIVMSLEVESFKKKVYLEDPNTPFDERPRAPVVDFIEMMDGGGMEIQEMCRISLIPGVDFFMVISKAQK